MKVIIGDRQTGKTTELIKRAAAQGGYIVTCSYKTRVYVMELAQKLNLDILFPITYEELLNDCHRGEKIPCLHIDDVERFVQYAAGPHHVATITINGEGTP